MDKAQQIARILCKLGETHLWHPRFNWAQELVPGINLYFRVGAGRQTCHAVRGDAHSITIGAECVREVLHSRKQASAWLSFDELKKHGYFEARQEPSEILVHTLCHEFAHFVQSVLGRRQGGLQHDRVFYTILDRIHGRGHADILLSEFKKKCAHAGISFRFEDTTRNLISGRVGECILAKTAGRILAGRILRQNKRSVTVGFKARNVEHKVRMSPSLIEPDNGSESADSTEWH